MAACSPCISGGPLRTEIIGCLTRFGLTINLSFQNRKKKWTSKALSCFIKNYITIQEWLDIPFRKASPETFPDNILHMHDECHLCKLYLSLSISFRPPRNPEKWVPPASQEEEPRLPAASGWPAVQPSQDRFGFLSGAFFTPQGHDSNLLQMSRGKVCVKYRLFSKCLLLTLERFERHQ